MKALALFLALLLCTLKLGAQTLQEGIVFLENENYTAARQTFEQIIAKTPTTPEAYYYMGESYYRDEKVELAKEWYNKGVAAVAKGAINYVGLGKLALDAGNTAEAKKNFDQAAKFSKSKDAMIFYLTGDAYLNSKNPDASNAILALQKAVELDAKKADYQILLGDAYLAKSDGGKSMSSYEAAKALEPKNPRAYIRIARLSNRARMYENAIAELEKAIQMDPNYAPAYKDLIELYYQEGMYSKMTPLLKTYIGLVGTDTEARARYIKYLYAQVKDYNEVIKEATAYLQQDPNNHVIQRLLAYSYFEKEQYKESQAAMEKFFAIVGDRQIFPSDYEMLAKAAAKNGNTELAMSNYKKVAELEPKKAADVYGMMAQAYYDAKNYKDAADAFSMKIKAGSATSTDYYYLGVSYYYQDSIARADAAFVKVTELAPTYITGFVWRARCSNKLDVSEPKAGLAKPHWEKVIELSLPEADKNKKNLVDAYAYLALLYYNLDDKANALVNTEKLLALEPENKTGLDIQAALKQ